MTQPSEPVDVSELVVGIIGGTGPQGLGLATRFAMAGLRVCVGSRDAGRADQAAVGIRDAVPSAQMSGAANDEVAAQSDIVVVAVPWDGHQQTVRSLAPQLAGRIVVDCVNPLGFDKRGAYGLTVAEGSAAEQAQSLLPGSRVVGAFHHLPAALLADTNADRVECDVLVVGDDRAATDTVQALADAAPGMRGIFAGRLRTAHTLEALTANIISINRRYQVEAGLRVTDV